MKKSLKIALKKSLYFILFYSKSFDILSKALTKLRKEHPCVILLYHRIVDDRSVYLDKGPVMHHRIEDFRKEIVYLKKHFLIVSMDQVVSQLRSGKGFEKPAVAITFDDGYLDNYTLAYPVLKEYRVSAAVYIATGLIGTAERTWTDQIELALINTEREFFHLPALFGDMKMPVKSKREKQRANIEIAEALKPRSDSGRRELMKGVLDYLGFNGNYAASRQRIMLNWDEVREMARNGITFGSHSHTHPILSRMSIQEAKEDIFISKQVIEEKLGSKVRHFAFPNGRAEDFSEELKEYCQEIGFQSIASVIYGLNRGIDHDVFVLKRIPAINPVWMLAGELLRLFLRKN